MTDLQPYKNTLMGLSYEDKMKISVWLQDQIDLERGEAIKEKAKKAGSMIDAFLNKASQRTSGAANSIADSFKQAFGGNSNTTDGPEKR
jgi:hypothetical protein